MNTRMLGWFVAIAIAVFILLLAIQEIVLHLRVRYPIPRMDYYPGVARQPTPWAAFGDAIRTDVAIFLHSAFMIFFWLAISALLWGLLITRRSSGPEK